uniref:Uncharacterized protein n=1 Tax=Aegilops tauschii subsp. strangulata TaxID=200361 RepID=A0A453EHG1_AEGTS
PDQADRIVFWVVSEIKNTSRIFSSVQAKAMKREQNCLAHELGCQS